MTRQAAIGRRQTAAGRRDGGFDPASSLLVHDIKNLSFRLGALLQNLENSYEDPLFKKSVVEILNDTVRRMNGIVQRCRDRKGEVIIKVPVDLNDILNRLVDSLPRPYQEKAGVFIEESYGRIPKIWGDAQLMKPTYLGTKPAAAKPAAKK